MANGDYHISDIYQGGYSALTPHYGDVFIGYRINPKTLGMTTDPRTANIIQDASIKLNTGAKHIELSAVSPEVFESIPQQQLKEMNRLSKLTGVDVSVHGPIVEPSGLTREGFSESNREAAERQMFSAVERSHDVNPEGNIPVTFHSSVILPGEIPPKGKQIEEALVINTETGGIQKIPIKERHFPGEEGKPDVKQELKRINEESWNENLRQLEYYAGMGQEAVNHAMATNILAEAEKKAGKDWTPDEKMMRSTFNRGKTFLNSSYQDLKKLFDYAYNNASPIEKDNIKEFYKEIELKAKKINQTPGDYKSVAIMKEIIDEGIEKLGQFTPPQMLRDLNDFSKENTIKTISNIALSSYKKFKDTSPIISIENPPAGGAFSTGGELKEIVEKSRERFVEEARKKGMSRNEAEKAAEKLIGVTWDVGHLNMLRKMGYEKEDIIKETEKVAPLVKHIHLSDNFGFEHTELPMGMGNVPVKEILEKLGKEGFDATKIIEAGSWWQHFKTPPFKETLEAFGSPIYSMQMAPYWNQSLGLQQDYYPGMGLMLPQTNYETFGAGFSQLPMELGGQRQGGEGSRMSGRPME
ncbi:MAG: TIM barrel protein [Candidatus Pacearchaeota archaeon]|nr:TIM barrel protein [Candidatus Pacearchaeota archaeon]